jgi:nitroreductase
MNSVMRTILDRKSVREYEKRPIEDDVKAQILQAILRAPTAGNMMLYSIIEVTDPVKKNSLARTCDNQPFIAKAPLILLFLADYQRWYDYFILCNVENVCKTNKVSMRKPGEGDLMIACCDALIAAQTAVIAAQSFGIGSCYIGDIMEKWEINRDLFKLPRYTFPICLLCFGYPTEGQRKRQKTPRFDEQFIIYKNTYKRLIPEELREMFADREYAFEQSGRLDGIENIGQRNYFKKFSADFTIEMSHSVKACLDNWLDQD